jgi:hypothetical protein
MNDKYIRIYQKFDLNEIKEHLLIYGDLSAACAKCKTMEIKLEETHCPSCQTEFKYVAFRNIRNHIPKMQKLLAHRPQMLIIDLEDYNRNMGALKAKEFLK